MQIGNKNYTEKTIRKLISKDCLEINDEKEILHEIKIFYQDIFKARDNCLNDSYLLEQVSFKKKVSSPDLGNPITVEELGNTLKKFKNNKSPGIDGISAGFLKVFWNQLKYIITNAINTGYLKEELSCS